MRYLCNRDGFIKPLLSLGILAILIYSGIQFGIPYYRYSAFKSEVKEITRVGLGNIEKIKAEVYEAAKNFKIPIEEKEIIVIRKKNTVQVQAAWSADVDIFGLYQKTLNFTIDVEE